MGLKRIRHARLLLSGIYLMPAALFGIGPFLISPLLFRLTHSPRHYPMNHHVFRRKLMILLI
jgi:hypothetical protein